MLTLKNQKRRLNHLAKQNRLATNTVFHRRQKVNPASFALEHTADFQRVHIMTFEQKFAALNEHFFFREFTFSETTFRPRPGHEVELADSLLWIGGAAVIFQLKERDVTDETSPEEERRWFERKVITKGTRQIRDTMTYLNTNPNINLTNHRGHEVSLRADQLRTLHKLVVYLPNQQLPSDCLHKKHHRSHMAGVIHLVSAYDYQGIIRTLLTPAELMDYLEYRATLITKWPEDTAMVPEPVIMGHYLRGDIDEKPDYSHYELLQALRHQTETWDMSGVIKVFSDRIISQGDATEYYPIISAIAELKRNELAEFKKRFTLSVEKARANEFVQPYRMAIPRTGCGFVFIPLTQELIQNRRIGLENLTVAQKHDQKLPRCLGVSFAPDTDGWYSAEWCYLDYPWEPDAELDRLLTESNPFRDVRHTKLNRYNFGKQKG